MTNHLTNDTLDQINAIHGRFGSWLAVGRHLAQRNSEPANNAPAIAALLSKAARGELKQSRRVLALLGREKREYRLALRFRDEAERTAVKQWLAGQGYSSLDKWFRAEVLPEVTK